MEKVDILIGVVGLVALIATGLGVALYDDGAHDYVIGSDTLAVTAGPEPVDAAGFSFEFVAPDNAYGADLSVRIVASGQANPTDTVTVTINILPPEGSDAQPTTGMESFSFADVQAGVDIAVMADDWVELPKAFRGDDAEVDAKTTMWGGPYTVEVFVDAPGTNPLSLVQLGDSYTAEVSGDTLLYTIAPDRPETETA